MSLTAEFPSEGKSSALITNGPHQHGISVVRPAKFRVGLNLKLRTLLDCGFTTRPALMEFAHFSTGRFLPKMENVDILARDQEASPVSKRRKKGVVV